MASCKPIIATKNGGIVEILGNAGILINANSKELAEAIEKLIEDPSLRKKYAQLAKERARIFDWANIANRYIKVIN
jgi:glycosyltransferase involved in cell wall biosynthesis